MQQLLHGFSFSMLFLLVVTGVLMFIGIRLYRGLLLPLLLPKADRQTHLETVDKVEILAWVLYALVCLYQALLSSLLVTVILLALIIFAFYDFWKNYFAGIILRFSDKIQVGDSISLNDYSGKVVAFGNRALKLISASGEEILVPYHLINTEVKIGKKRVPKVLYKTLVLDAEVQDHGKARIQLEKALYKNPWIIISKPIGISLEDQQAILNFYVLNNDFFEKAKRRLIRDLESVKM